MYTYDGSDWVKTKMSQTVLSVGKLSALSADLGTIEAGYLNTVEIDSSTIKAANIDAKSTITGASITGASIEEDSDNGRITLDKGGFCAISNGKYLQFVTGNSNGYTQIRGGLDIDSINVGASVIKGQTFSAYGGNNTHIGSENAWTYLAERIKCGSTDSGHPSISSTIGTDIYFHNEAGSTIDIHAGDVISHGTNLLKEIRRVDGKPDSSGDVNRIDGDIGNIRGDISRIDGDIERIRGEISNIKSELKRKKNK